ncbi:MAG: CcdB family protein [Magnetococcales bacterium]|nr:CcdB family protein [Magnetococcales bacterium]
MAQFDFYQYKKRGKPEIFLVDIQSDLLDDMNTRVVIPIRPLDPGQKPIRILQPTIEWALGTYYFSTSEMAAISTAELKLKMGNLSEMRSEIIAAIDLLFTGI